MPGSGQSEPERVAEERRIQRDIAEARARAPRNEGLSDPRAISEMLAAVVASSDDAIAVKDLNGTILAWNASAERIFGYTSDEIVGISSWSATLLAGRGTATRLGLCAAGTPA